MNDNLDDYEFTPTASTNLASLFGSTSANLDVSSLTYTAPKQPKPISHVEMKTEMSKTEKVESSVLSAVVVQVWKLIDNKYVATGKLGLAIIGSATKNSFEMILYKDKHNVVIRIKICSDFDFILKKDGFASFYDSSKGNWLIKFDNGDDCKTITDYVTKFGGKVEIAIEKIEDQGMKADCVKSVEGTPITDNVETKAKADILSRIARMGQSILPNKNSEVETDPVDEYDKSGNNVSYEVNKCNENYAVSPPTTVTNIIQVPKHSQNIPSNIFMGQTMPYDTLNVYVAENRAHNTEVRLNLSQVTEKLNNILKVVDCEKPQTNNSDALKSKIKVLDLRIENLCKEIQTYQKENLKLKQEISKQNEILTTEKQMEIMLMKDEENSKIANLQIEIHSYKATVDDLSETVDKQKKEIQELKMQHENDTKLQDEIVELNATISDLKIKIKNCEQENASRQNDSQNKENSAYFILILKDLMNELYGNIIESISDGKNYTSSEMNSIIAQNIKSTTLKVIQKCQDTYKNEPDVS